MDLFKMTKAGMGVFAGRMSGKPAPMFVIWAATNRCQSDCTYCNIPHRPQPDMDTAQTRKMIDEIVEMGCQRFGIWGGEPLMRDDIGEIIDYAVDKGLYVTLITNGYAVPDKIDQMKNLHHLLVSLDGPEEAHDANREPGSFKKALEAIKTASKKGIKIWTITVLTANNCNEKSIDFLLDLADEYGFMATFQLLHHQEGFGDSNSLRPSDEVYRNTIRYLLKKKDEGRRIGTSHHFFNYLLDWKDYKVTTLPEGRKGRPCWGGKFFANVDADGDVYACSLLVKEVDAKNCVKVGFKEAYEGIPKLPCNSCLATCYTEYNMLFDLDFATIFEWVNAFRRKSE